ncbi:MAG: hypothetical protein JWN72_314 [Thermoleophilia bacterium]|nr:hypothetical protein [Thermoleophilia bacterium]
MVRHALAHSRTIAAMSLLAFVPPFAALLVALILGGGVEALRSNTTGLSILVQLGIAVGFAWSVPAILRVLHIGDDFRAASTWSMQRLPGNALIASTAVPCALLANALWPGIWDTAVELMMVESLAMMPVVIGCQLLWMQQVADGGDLPTVAVDWWHLTRHYAGSLVLWLAPAYVVLFSLLAANLIPVLTGPVALTLAAAPFTVWTWRTWCELTATRPAWLEPADVLADLDPAVATPQQQQEAATVMQGGSGPARLRQLTGIGSPTGVWLATRAGDSFTVTVRPGDAGQAAWQVFTWRPGAQWRQLPQLWNDGRTLIAHGTAWGEHTFIAITRMDGMAGVPYDAWVSVATGALVLDDTQTTEARDAA